MNVFHTRLKELKEQSDLTQAKIAEQLGITPQAFSYIVNGREPSYEVLTKIASLFNVSTDWLLGVSEIKTPDADVRMVAEYTGLREKSINYLHTLISSPINSDNEFVSFLNEIFENPSFQLMLYNLYSFRTSIMGTRLYWKLWNIVHPKDSPTSTDERLILEAQLSELIQQTVNEGKYSEEVLDALCIQSEILSSNSPLAEALWRVEEFKMSDIDEYRASQNFASLTNDISEYAKKSLNAIGTQSHNPI